VLGETELRIVFPSVSMYELLELRSMVQEVIADATVKKES